MSKSAFILDTPESCNKCRFSERRVDGSNRCILDKESGRKAPILWIAEWCPLNPISEFLNKRKEELAKDFKSPEECKEIEDRIAFQTTIGRALEIQDLIKFLEEMED